MLDICHVKAIIYVEKSAFSHRLEAYCPSSSPGALAPTRLRPARVQSTKLAAVMSQRHRNAKNHHAHRPQNVCSEIGQDSG